MKDITLSISKALLEFDKQYKNELPRLTTDPIGMFKYLKTKEVISMVNDAVDPFGELRDDMASAAPDLVDTDEFEEIRYKTAIEIINAVRNVLSDAINESNKQ